MEPFFDKDRKVDMQKMFYEDKKLRFIRVINQVVQIKQKRTHYGGYIIFTWVTYSRR